MKIRKRIVKKSCSDVLWISVCCFILPISYFFLRKSVCRNHLGGTTPLSPAPIPAPRLETCRKHVALFTFHFRSAVKRISLSITFHNLLFCGPFLVQNVLKIWKKWSIKVPKFCSPISVWTMISLIRIQNSEIYSTKSMYGSFSLHMRFWKNRGSGWIFLFFY